MFLQKFFVQSNVVEECLREKADIERVLTERAKLGPFLIESIERPLVDNMTTFNGLTYFFSKTDFLL